MHDILHDFTIKASPSDVFDAISTPDGLDRWWTRQSGGAPTVGAPYKLDFGPGFDWQALVTECAPSRAFELEMTQADHDWVGTRVGFHLEPGDGMTRVRFYHTGWPSANEHYRVSCYCWAMYLRVLKRALEYGESVPYESRLEV